MQAIFVTLGLGLLALLAVAVTVSLLEYLRSLGRPITLPLPPPPARAVSVDLDLDRMDAAPPPGDQQQRQATVGQALARMAQPGAAAASDTAWIETRPTVLNGTAETTLNAE